MNTDFERITTAIHYIQSHFKVQPDLDAVAAHVHLSPFHFQRLFSAWAGTSPKKFLQYISLAYAKNLLRENASVFDVALATGLSGTGRLHDLFVSIEGMTPGEYKNGGERLVIRHSAAQTPFGDVLLASTDKGICHMAFYDDAEQALASMLEKFPRASYQQEVDNIQQQALHIFKHNHGDLQQIKLHLRGSDFQLKVWEALLQIPLGQLSSYGDIAQYVGKPRAARAVGTAVGDNPVAFLIPCHRVIQASGALGGYRWGLSRKRAMIGWEMARVDQ